MRACECCGVLGEALLDDFLSQSDSKQENKHGYRPSKLVVLIPDKL